MSELTESFTWHATFAGSLIVPGVGGEGGGVLEDGGWPLGTEVQIFFWR